MTTIEGMGNARVKALILIDYTVDFVAPVGKLTVGKPGQLLEGVICKKIRDYAAAGDLIFTVNDHHEANDLHHPEHRLFPPHNLTGSEGRRLYGETESVLAAVEEEKPGQVIRLDKRRYSAFCGTPLEVILRQEGVERIEFAGVCTDICILHTAVDAYNKGFRAMIDEGAVASFNAQAHEIALGHFQSVLGFDVRRRG